MCGIIGYTGARQAVPLLLEGLSRLEYRGYDSAGVVVLDAAPRGGPGTVQLVRRVGKIAELSAAVEVEAPQGSCGVGHTRWATHGAPSEPNAHPIPFGSITVVHNGIIENHRALRSRLEDAGHTFSSQTDTEVIAHLVALAYEQTKDLHAAVKQAVTELDGAWAVAVTSDELPDEIVVARHASPLLIGLTNEAQAKERGGPETFVASDVAAVLAHTRLVIDLEDGDTARVRPDAVEIHDANGERVHRPRRRIDWSPHAAEKQGFKHFMLKEITEQPRAIRDTLMGHLGELGGHEGAVEFAELGESLGDYGRLTILGCGTSWHAGLCGKYLVEQLARIPVEVDLASEFRYREPIVRPGDLALAISQSGETADTLAALKEAKRLGARTIAISNVVDSSIARAADHVLYTHAGPEISVASTKAFTTQLTMLTMLAVWLGRSRGTLEEQRARRLVEDLRELPVAIDTVLEQRALVKTIARRYASARDMMYLGRGLSFPVALEGALKLKEISYLHAEGFASGEMKHGPIAMVDDEMPVVVIALEGPGYEKVISNLEEVRARGGKIIALANVGDAQIGDLADDVVLIPRVDPMLQPILASVPLQLLAYYIADHKGTDVDQPRNLAKSVTVE